MKLSVFKGYMIPLYLSSLKNRKGNNKSKKGFAVDLRGRVGHGKTWTFEQFPELAAEAFAGMELEGEYACRTIEGASLTHSGALGYMWPGEDADGRKNSDFTEPYWMYVLCEDGKRRHLSEFKGGILVVDDWHLIDTEIKKIFAQAAYEGILANHVLPPGWVIWFCGNRPQDRSGFTREFEHTVTRLIRIEISDDFEGLIEFFEVNGALKETVEFIKKIGAEKHIYVPPPKDIEPYCTPRTLFQSDMLVQELMEMFGMSEPPTDPNVLELIGGSIGKSAAHDYIVYLEEANALISAADVAKNPMGAKLPPDDRPDLWRLQAYKLAAEMEVKTADQCLKYMERFPKEFQTIFVRSVGTNKSKVAALLKPKMYEWSKKNMVLIAAITGLEEAAE